MKDDSLFQSCAKASKPLELKWFVKKNTWLSREYCDVGWGNGYVCVPEGHRCFGLSYDEIHEKFDISAHGGLTFSDSSKGLEWPEIPEGEWWIIGFDTAHYGDSLSNWPKAIVEIETQRILKQLEQ